MTAETAATVGASAPDSGSLRRSTPTLRVHAGLPRRPAAACASGSPVSGCSAGLDPYATTCRWCAPAAIRSSVPSRRRRMVAGAGAVEGGGAGGNPGGSSRSRMEPFSVGSAPSRLYALRWPLTFGAGMVLAGEREVAGEVAAVVAAGCVEAEGAGWALEARLCGSASREARAWRMSAGVTGALGGVVLGVLIRFDGG